MPNNEPDEAPSEPASVFSITGFSPMHAGSPHANKKGLQGLGTLLPAILREYGMTANFTREGLPPADNNYNVVFILPPGSMNTSNIVNALRVLDRDPQSVVALDDWQVERLFKEFRKHADGYVSKTHHLYKPEDIMPFRHVFQRISDGQYRVLVPAYQNGDHSKLGIPGGDLHFVDPSAYVVNPDPNYLIPKRRERFEVIHASLAAVKNMPPAKRNWVNSRPYEIRHIRGDKDRGETEVEVYRLYCDGGLVLSPPHYHHGSGWFRNRYSLAQYAHALVVDDAGGPFGRSHEVMPADVNSENFDDLFEAQRASYENVIMTKDEIKVRLRAVFDRS